MSRRAAVAGAMIVYLAAAATLGYWLIAAGRAKLAEVEARMLQVEMLDKQVGELSKLVAR